MSCSLWSTAVFLSGLLFRPFARFKALPGRCVDFLPTSHFFPKSPDPNTLFVFFLTPKKPGFVGLPPCVSKSLCRFYLSCPPPKFQIQLCVGVGPFRGFPVPPEPGKTLAFVTLPETFPNKFLPFSVVPFQALRKFFRTTPFGLL